MQIEQSLQAAMDVEEDEGVGQPSTSQASTLIMGGDDLE